MLLRKATLLARGRSVGQPIRARNVGQQDAVSRQKLDVTDDGVATIQVLEHCRVGPVRSRCHPVISPVSSHGRTLDCTRRDIAAGRPSPPLQNALNRARSAILLRAPSEVRLSVAVAQWLWSSSRATRRAMSSTSAWDRTAEPCCMAWRSRRRTKAEVGMPSPLAR